MYRVPSLRKLGETKQSVDRPCGLHSAPQAIVLLEQPLQGRKTQKINHKNYAQSTHEGPTTFFLVCVFSPFLGEGRTLYSLGKVKRALNMARRPRNSISKNSRPLMLVTVTSVWPRPTCHQNSPAPPLSMSASLSMTLAARIRHSVTLRDSGCRYPSQRHSS